MTPLLLLAALAAAPPARAQTPSVSTAPARALRQISDDELPDFEDSFPSRNGLRRAAQRTLAYLSKADGPRYFKLAEREYAVGALIESAEALLEILKDDPPPEELKKRVREAFDVFQSIGSDGQGKVVFSAYYQPVLQASLAKSPAYPYPLYRKPLDMVTADLGVFDRKWEGESLVARVDKDKRLVPYFTREQIDVRKALAGKGLEIAWLKDKFDRLDLHIQGSGILRFPSGKELLAKFSATNARPYNSVGLTLVKAGVFTRDEISREKLKSYLRAHPEGEDWLLSQNPRYTFFELAPLPPDGEPFGTTEQSLVPARSIAIDPAIIPLGALAWFSAPSPQSDKDGNLLGQFPASRFAFCLDTGGAIKGPGRVDIYAGHGPQAATSARSQWSEGKLYVLIKKLPPRER